MSSLIARLGRLLGRSAVLTGLAFAAPGPSAELGLATDHSARREHAQSGSGPAEPERQCLGLGAAIAQGPDLDGDGAPELLVAARGILESGSEVLCGVVWAISTKSWKPIRAWQGAGPDDRLGTAICTLDDLDADGIADIAISSPGSGKGSGSVELFSGRTGLGIRKILPSSSDTGFGGALELLPDLDGDGFRDLAIGAPHGANGVSLVSPIAGTLLRHIPGPQKSCRFGSTLDAARDLTGDGRIDLVIGAPDYRPSPDNRAGLVNVISLAEGRLAASFEGAWPNQRLGTALCTAGSRGQDSVLVLISSVPQAQGCYSGWIQVYEGRTFRIRRQCGLAEAWEAETPGFSAVATSIGDVTGDGFEELVVGLADFTTFWDCDGAAFALDPLDCGRFVCLQSKWADETHGLDSAEVGRFGQAVARLDDLDGDGIADYAIGAAGDFVTPYGGVHVLSAKKLKLREILGFQLALP